MSLLITSGQSNLT